MSKGTTSTSDGELGSFEGRYPDRLFNKTFVIDNQTLGYVAKETKDLVVIFGESGNGRYDIPKSEIVSLGGGVTIRDVSLLDTYKQNRDSPLPEESLRPSAETIMQRSRLYQRKESGPKNTPEAVIQEREELARAPRTETTYASDPTDYHEQPESELVRKAKNAAKELKELFYAGSKVATKKARKKKEELEEKRAQMDAERIANMGNLAFQFTDDFDGILAEIRARPYSQQVRMYNGLITLMDYQRALAVARRDMAARVQDSVPNPTVPPRQTQTLKRRKNVKSGVKRTNK
jgi:hypothetical protein